MWHSGRLLPGQRIAGRFRIERLAGAGGMGEVYRARDEVTGEPVAVKVSRESVEDEARFLREARLLESLRDPDIVAHHGHGRLEDGRPFLAMAWLEGESLADRLARGTLSITETLTIVRAVARALGAAHRRGIVHRDVKPSNVLLCPDPDAGPGAVRPRLIDFGIARHTTIRGATVTKTNAALGTPYYMAPEQVRGARDAGPAADVFSLGCLLYECLTGRSPFQQDTLLAALAAVLLEEPVPLRRLVPEVSAELERLALRLLAKDAANRPVDGDAVVDELDALTSSETSAASVATPGTIAGLSRREQRVVLVLVALPSEVRRAVEVTQRADEPDPTSLRLRALVEQSEGKVEISAEGALVASFADEDATRDRVERAVRCARAVVASDPGARVGLVSGRAVAGRVPVGEVVERAIGLARALPAGVGGVVVDDDVAAFAAASSVLEPIASPPGGARLGPPRATYASRAGRIFGRDRELVAMRSAVEEALDEPVSRALVLSGDAGLGKTRLLDELATGLVEVRPALRVLRVRSQPTDREAPLALALRLVRTAAGIEEGEPIDTRRRKLASHLEAIEGASLSRDLGELARIPSLDGPDDDVLRDDRFLRGDLERRAFVDWLGLLARHEEGTLLVVDDAHHADVTSLELLAEATLALRARPFVLLVAARPDERADRAPLDVALARVEPERHRLGKLLPRAARALVDDVLGPDPSVTDEVRGALVARGEGNPFFLRELAAARARGSESPSSILAAVEERILRTGEETRRTLRAVSLLGEPSTIDLVAALVPALDRAQLEACLDELDRAELVDLSRSPGALVRVRPRSALVADAAYAMIPDDERVAAHRIAGSRLASEGAEPARVARHFEHGGEPVRAAEAYRDAAERALEAHDLARADAHAARGLSLSDELTPTLRGELCLGRAQAARWQGAYAQAFGFAEESVVLLERSVREDPSPDDAARSERARRLLEALGVWIASASALGRVEALERAEALLFRTPHVQTDDRALRALEVVTVCRGAAAWLGRADRARADRWLDRARARAGVAPAPIADAWLHALSASRALHDGDLATFLVDTERAIDAYERAGDARNACNQRVRLANALVSVGALARAEPLLVRARADAERMHLSLVAAYAVQNLGHVLGRLGRDAEARAALQDAEGRGARLGDRQLVTGSRLYLALLCLEDDRPAVRTQALEPARRALEAATDDGPFRAIAHAVYARAALAVGDLATAVTSIDGAIRWLDAHGPIEEGEATVRRAHAEVLLATGREAEAHAVARRALTALETRAAALPEALRAGFLDGHPDHRRLRALR